MESTYRIQLQEFEGPLDLLLFFIRRDELDIHNIPIAQITDEFLAYLHLIERIDLDSVADFIYMAAVLIQIKAKMLLPADEVGEEGEPVDPRRELVERLLEYIRFKEASALLAQAEEQRARYFTRGEAAAVCMEIEEAEPESVVQASMWDLIRAVQRILNRVPEQPPTHAVQRLEYSIEQQQDYLLGLLAEKGRLNFLEAIEGRTRGFIISTFLAVLELARQGALEIYVSERLQDFYLCLTSNAEAATEARSAVAEQFA